MLWTRRYDAFISYSHKDQAVVEPLVKLLSLNDRRVFWDHNLKPGDQWNRVIQSSVKDSSVFVLFWCCDTRGSEAVTEEISLALRLHKKIVPVKLCPAAMPPPLGEWQWIDLQSRVQHVCGDLDHGIVGNTLPALPPHKEFAKNLWLLSCLTVIGLALFTLIGLVSHRSKHAEPPNADAALHRPIPPGDPHSIREVTNDGEVGQRHQLPYNFPGAPQAHVQEIALPWWYANRLVLYWAGAFAVASGLLGWLVVTRRNRVGQTVKITTGYLDHLAQPT